MKIYKSTQVELTQKLISPNLGSNDLSIGIVYGFKLAEDCEVRPVKDLVWQLAKKTMGDKVVFDECLPKHQSEFLAFGSCFCPEGAPQPLPVSISVGSVKKQLVVYGDRHFKAGGMISNPESFHEIPIAPEYSFGGEGFALNPKGKGVSNASTQEKQLPNIETLNRLMTHDGDIVPVSGFWSLPADHPERVCLLGKFDQNWFKTRWPDLPLDTQPAYFQVAPLDQRINGFLTGSESISITHMHETKSHIQAKIPGVRARLIYENMEEPGGLLREVATTCETLYLFPNDLFGLILFRGVIPLGSKNDADVLKIYADVEPANTAFVDASVLVDRILGATNIATPTENKVTSPSNGDNKIEQTTTAEVSSGSSKSTNSDINKSASNALNEKMSALGKSISDTMAKLGVSEADIIKLKNKSENEKPTSGNDIDKVLSNTKKAMLDLFKNFNIDEKQIIQKMMENPKSQAAAQEIQRSGAGIAGLFASMEQALSTIKTPPPPKTDKALPPKTKDTQPPPPKPEADSAKVYVRADIEAMLALGERNFSGLKLSSLDLSALDFSGVDFSKSQLDCANFSGSTLVKSRFDQAVLKEAQFHNVKAEGSTFKSASMQKSNWEGASLTSCDFSSADCTNSSFTSVKFKGTTLSATALFDCNLSATLFNECTVLKAHMDGSNLSAVKFISSNASGSTFVKTRCIGSEFLESDLSKTNFGSASGNALVVKKCNLDDSIADKSTVFSRSTFTDTTLNRVNWQGVSAQGCTFSNTKMVGSLFSKAVFDFNRFETVDARGASFDGASFKNADLLSSNFMEASLKASNLEGSKIIGSNLFGANLAQSITKNLIIDKTNIDRTILAVRLF